MKPQNLEFGGGVNHTVMHPAVMAAMLVTILLVLLLPRKYVVIPFLLCVFLVPRGLQFYVAGMHWYVGIRIVILAGLVRLARAKFQVAGKLNGIDKAFILWAIYSGLCMMLLYPQRGMVIHQGAFWLEAFGGYFLLRYSIQDEEDISRAAKTLAALAVILGVSMLNECFHGVNVFGYLGGAQLIPVARAGQIRAQATFGHPILAGCFGATLVPLFFWLWRSGRSKALAEAGMGGAIFMVLTSASSTPLFACLAGVGSLLLWPIRRSMRAARWGIVLALLALAVVMKGPVWFVIAHAHVIGASESLHRALLVDTFFRHFRDWWLIGTNETNTWGFGMWDHSNQFVAEGEAGGLLTLICFIAMISLSFSRLGKMMRQVEGDRRQEWLFWSLGAFMVANVVAFFGIRYWDQMAILWWAFLAMVSAATAQLQTNPARAAIPALYEPPNSAWEQPTRTGRAP